MRTRLFLAHGGRSRSTAAGMPPPDSWTTPEDADWVVLRASRGATSLVADLTPQFQCSSESRLMPEDVHTGMRRSGIGFLVPLADALDIVNGRCAVNIEIETEEHVEPAVRIIHDFIYRRGWSYPLFMVTSPSVGVLRQLRRHDHHVKRALDVGVTPEYAAQLALDVDAYAMFVHGSRVDAALSEECHRSGLMLFATDVHEIEHMDALVGLGADGFSTGFAERAARWRARQSSHETARRFAPVNVPALAPLAE